MNAETLITSAIASGLGVAICLLMDIEGKGGDMYSSIMKGAMYGGVTFGSILIYKNFIA